MIWISGSLPSGKRVYKSTRLRNWTRAESLVHAWELEGVPTQQARVTIEDWRIAFLQDAGARNLSKETTRKYHRAFRQLEVFAQDKGIRYVNEFDLPLLSEFRAGWKVAPLTAVKELEILRGFFRFALARKWVEGNPAASLKAPKVKQSPTLPFTQDEMNRILKAADSKVKAFILTMRYSGLRISDAAMLEVSSLKGNHLKLYQAKTGEYVSVLLPEFVADALRALKNSNPKYFFSTGYSKPTSVTGMWRKRLAKVFKAAQISDAHSHRLRDTFAVSLLESGVSLENVSTLLGHQSLKITAQHYSPWVKSRQQALDDAVRKVLQFDDMKG